MDKVSQGLPSESPTFKELKNLIEAKFGENAVNDNKINRFLIARDDDVKQAYIMLEKDLEWRKTHNVDTILQNYHIPELFRKYYTLSMIGFDKDDLPILLFNFGEMDHKGFAKATRKEELMRHLIYFYENIRRQIIQHSQEVGRHPVDKCIMILNMEGLSFSQLSNKQVIERSIDVCVMNDAHYPETLRTAYIINASTTFQLFYSFLRPFISQTTQQKVKFYGKDGWKEEFLKFIDPQVLPAYMGGERTDPDGDPMCHTIVCHGGIVPEELYLKNLTKTYLRNEPGVKSHVLKRRSKFSIPLEAEAEGSFIEWEFETDNYDVAYGLFYRNFKSSENDELVPLIPLQRSDSYQFRETGAFKCEKPGIYILTFDNSYSFFRSKNIYYKVSVVKPDEKKTDVPK